MQAAQGAYDHAVSTLAELLAQNPEAFNLAAEDYAKAALNSSRAPQALAAMSAQFDRHPGMQLLLALALLETDPAAQRTRLVRLLREHPTLTAARMLLRQSAVRVQVSEDEGNLITTALDRIARPLQRYRCAACGFEAGHYFWQCPGCLNWDSYPPRHVEEL